MCCYEQQVLQWVDEWRDRRGGEEEYEEEEVRFHRRRDSHLSKEGSEEQEEN